MTANQIDVAALTFSYRRLVLWFGAQLLLNCGSFGFHAVQGESVLGAVVGLVFVAGLLATIIALAYYGFRTAAALGSRVAWLWAIVMFVPCVNVISLLALSSKAQRVCAARGIPVGLLGPKLDPVATQGRGPGV